MENMYDIFLKASITWRKIREARDKEIDTFNYLANSVVTIKSNKKTQSRGLFIIQIYNYTNKIFSEFFQISKNILQIIFELTKKRFFDLDYESIIVAAPSRLVKVNGKSIKEKLLSSSKTKYKTNEVGEWLKNIAKTKSLYLIPAYKKEIKYIEHNPNNFGSNSDLINLILELSIFNLLNCLPLIIKKSKNNKEIFELILLLAFINFLNKRSIKKILFLTGNSRTSDALLIASSVLKIETREYLHGIPSKFVYERAHILNKNNPNNKAIRLIPINDYCIFSKNNNSEFFNHNFDNLIINSKRSSEKHYKKLVFGGCTSHHKNYLDSGVYQLEIIILEYLNKYLKNKILEIMYVPHPSQIFTELNLPKEIKVSKKGIYNELSDATHCMALLSSVAWEANYFGIKSMICIPNAELIFDKTDLKQIYSLKNYDIDFLKKEINKFIN